MHGYRRPRHLVPLPISPSTSLLAPSLSAPLQPRSLKPQSIRQRASHAAARGNARVALSSVLYISSRFIASTTTASSSHETATASSIRSTQDLHTALISLAQAATAASASPTFGAARKAPSSPLERTLFKETATATRGFWRNTVDGCSADIARRHREERQFELPASPLTSELLSRRHGRHGAPAASAVTPAPAQQSALTE